MCLAAFGFVKPPTRVDRSSIMPNKRNPDAAELVRGHSARIVGDLVALLVLLKGLPLAYAKDLQDDKPPLFDAHDLLELSLAAMAGMISDLEFVPERMRAAAAAGHATATDLADWLASEANVPFREAHHIAGRAVPPPKQQVKHSMSSASLSFVPSIRGSTSASSAMSVEARSPRAARLAALRRRVRQAIAAARAEIGRAGGK